MLFGIAARQLDCCGGVGVAFMTYGLGLLPELSQVEHPSSIRLNSCPNFHKK